MKRFTGKLLEELVEPMQLLLLAIGVLSALWGEAEDAVAIFAIVAVVVTLETAVEARAARAIDALHSLAAPTARVRRDGAVVVVDPAEVAVGDVAVLRAGDIVPADGRLLSADGLHVDESMLTGEAAPVAKGPVGAPDVFAGTAVTQGRGEAQVTAIGQDTEAGRLGVLMAAQREPRTPLQRYMRSLAKTALVVAIGVSVLVPLIGAAQGQPGRDMVLAGLTLAFATVPEELPILVSALLALGGHRLAKRGALVRRLHAAETLGGVTVVVTDKTGTLTENRLDVAEVVGDRDAVLRAMALDDEGPDVERAFSFDPVRKRSSAIVDGAVIVRGAPESVLACCDDPPPDALATAERLAAAGRRVLAAAARPVGPSLPTTAEEAERGLAFLGLVAYEDPLRAGVPEAVAALRRAGVQTVMVTGDAPATAHAVARAVGIEDVHARATPADKLDVVRRLQADGHVVAVTGDGVNDAPALKAADVGVAMGARGTDLARAAAGVVLVDDAYPTLVAAVEGGRNIRTQLRRAVAFYLGAKLALTLVIGLPLLFGRPSPFEPVHVVLLELFMDLGASVAFLAEPAAPGLLAQPPPHPKAPFLDRAELVAVGAVAIVLAAAVLTADALGMTAVVAWLPLHVVVAWSLRARPGAPLRANPFFPLWLAAAATTAVLIGLG